MMGKREQAALQRLGEALQQAGYRHTTVTPATHARVNARPGNQLADDLRGVFGWSRPFRPAVLPGYIFALMQEAGIAVSGDKGWRSLLRASTLNGNLYFHSAWPTDDPAAVFFGPDTYRYVAALSQYFATQNPVQQQQQVRRAADIGCGSGAGAIELALRLPQTEVMAIDINEAALQLTQVNAKAAGVSIQTVNSDLLTQVEGNFDLIVANPPYMVDHAQRKYRHGGGALGAALSLSIIDTALERLNPGGTLLLYTGSAIVDGVDFFLREVRQRLQGNCSWSYRELDPDVFGEELETDTYALADRIAAVFLCAKVPGGISASQPLVTATTRSAGERERQ